MNVVNTTVMDGGGGSSTTNQTVRYNAANMMEAIRDININVVGPAAQALTDNVNDCCEKIEAVWVGKASKAFQSKLKKDTTDIAMRLRGMGYKMQQSLHNVGSNMEEYDNALAKQIANW